MKGFSLEVFTGPSGPDIPDSRNLSLGTGSVLFDCHRVSVYVPTADRLNGPDHSSA